MINEIYRLTEALDQTGISVEDTHLKYKTIPQVTRKAPCVHIILAGGEIYKVESIEKEQAAEIRKYGTNQGTYPAMNLAQLYRLTEETEKKFISDLIEGKSTDYHIEEIHQLCKEKNWGKKFGKKYRICMQVVPREMQDMFQRTGVSFPQLLQLIEETSSFLKEEDLHRELERIVFKMLTEKKEVALALKILFHLEKPEMTEKDDYGSLSVVWDSRSLIKEGLSVATASFTDTLNKKLMEADAAVVMGGTGQQVDAFGEKFEPVKRPMPTVKLAAGFEVSLRTMFRGQPCQNRYDRNEDASYPISKELRHKLQSALAWISNTEHKGITWISTDKNEVLLAYPETLRDNKYSIVNFLKCPKKTEEDAEDESKDAIWRKKDFESATKDFIDIMKQKKAPGTDSKSERIQYFILRKLDKARTRVVYTYNTSPEEIEQRSEQWSSGCQNLPSFTFGRPNTLFPLEVSDILNEVWRQDGELSTDKFKPVPRYHGMQMLFGEEPAAIRRDLYVLMSNAANLAPYVGKRECIKGEYDSKQFLLMNQTKKVLALMGLLLYQLGIRKENYMQEFPYLFGQLVKVSDELHTMYCRVVRNNDVPNMLAGSGMYTTGAEQPYKALAILGQRMNPYITWAKSYRTKDIQTKNEESWRAGWYLMLYENIATQLYAAWGSQTRFGEEEKAQYFIGYLAAFPKKEKPADDKCTEEGKKETDEMIEKMNGGSEND